MPFRKISRFSTENLLPHSTEDFRRGTLLCFTRIPLSKKFLDKKFGGGGRREGVSRFKVKSFLSHSSENIRRRNLLCCVSEIFW